MQDKVIAVVSQVLGVPKESVTDATSPETVENWDSLRHMDLVLALEEEFGIRLSDERILALLNVKAIVRTVEDLTRASRS
jgi:acyl carrier protein